MRTVITMLVLSGGLAVPAGAQTLSEQADLKCRALRDLYLSQFKPLFVEANAASWEASTTGTDAAFARKKAADKALVELHGNRELFEQIQSLREGGQVSDPVLRRELDEMYRAFLPGQADPALRKRIVDLESDVEQVFNTHRSRVRNRTLTENEVRAILAGTTDSAEARAAWMGYMHVGKKVAANLAELVRLRNEMARQLGFENFYSMSLALQEIDEKALFRLFGELDALTREPFAKLKREVDASRAERFGIAAAELRPWHYGDLFFQEAPAGEEVSLDDLFAGADLIALNRKYYESIGLQVDDVLARSDLYERPGKDPHAFCTDIDRAGDVRVLCNMKPNLYWADTLLHELGHGVYDRYIGPEVPFLLRRSAHAITTEGVANLFGALSKNEEWLTEVLGVDAAEASRVGQAARATLRREKLIFARWAQVMVRFERGMYSDPNQDLGRLWWDLKQKFQLLNPPEAVSVSDYAAKTHVLSSPVYYHSYLMGDLFAAQVRHHMAREVLGLHDVSETSFYGRPEAGEFLREEIFGPGSLYSWDELIRRATGESLTAKFFAAQLTE